ncbi:S1/P1 nuclease [Sphingomonas sp. QA11]|uniref:S1/P1 nuclease n=1 Tax=Sphingomonas sp. QA11 TaxID=2950605 RepID=UPI00234A06E3|nr:S1/P1 nuclease [Sphingomonas sp. QA11]WCM26061.1 S1/P1 nuclease [Sphingomonas sp. QA11]
MSRLLPALAAVALAATASPAAAYWEYGHQTIARIAQANVKPKTRVAIDRLLRRSALLGTPTCPARSIEDASVWADCVKTIKSPDGKRPFDFAYSWHYQNVNICKPFDLVVPCKDGNCVSAQIERDVKLLRDKTTPVKDRVQALAFLIHFVGDLHQPLHAGDKADKGGNDAKTSYGLLATPRLNLHTVWDGYLAERAISTPPSVVRHYSATERATMAAGDVTDWSRESWQIARDSAYASAMKGDPCAPTPEHMTLDDATIASLVPVERLEVQRGGLRLAKLLDKAFS